VLILTKIGLGHILGYFFTNTSGHPASDQRGANPTTICCVFTMLALPIMIIGLTPGLVGLGLGDEKNINTMFLQTHPPISEALGKIFLFLFAQNISTGKVFFYAEKSK
jgi:hypothetical protein